jgi:hypothetical protein
MLGACWAVAGEHACACVVTGVGRGDVSCSGVMVNAPAGGIGTGRSQGDARVERGHARGSVCLFTGMERLSVMSVSC